MDRKSNVKCGVLNIQSVTNHTVEIHELILEKGLDILALTETWLKGDQSEKAKINEFVPRTHKFYSVPRNVQGIERGGGVGLIVSKNFRVQNIEATPIVVSSFEYIDLKINCLNNKLRLLLIYRPPSWNKNVYLMEFNDYLDTLNEELYWTVMCGDFNIHVDNDRDNFANSFKECLESHSIKNWVSCPTAKSNHTLDLVISDINRKLVKNIVVEHLNPAHFHYLVLFDIDVRKKDGVFMKKNFRVKRNFNADTFIHESVRKIDNESSGECVCPGKIAKINECVSCYVTLFRKTFKENYDIMCPTIEKVIKVVEHAPWFSAEIREARKKRRCAELRWQRKKTDERHKEFVEARNYVTSLIRKTKRAYYNNKLKESENDSKALYGVMNEITGNKTEEILPDNDNKEELANDFADFFIQKIEIILSKMDASVEEPDEREFIEHTVLKDFQKITESDVKDIIKESKKSFNANDPFPINDVLESRNLNELLKLYANIINLSLSTGVFPASEKNGVIRPYYKGSGDPNSFKPYRPVTNLSFFSKVLEKTVKAQITLQLEAVSAIPSNQSAYRKYHSTESTVCSVMDDLLRAMDRGRLSLLLLLDLSAAFDTVDHSKLIKDLENCGIQGTVRDWFISYLSLRTFAVSIDNEFSSKRNLHRGVPQGSVLGPVLFNVYTAGLAEVLERHQLGYKQYADDTQIYLVIDSLPEDIVRIKRVTKDIKTWMTRKKLELNISKTKCMIIGTPRNLELNVDTDTIKISNDPDGEIELVKSVNNLGVLIDNNINLKMQINNVVKTANFHLRNICFIRKYLDKASTQKLVYNNVISRLDYCNSLYVNLPSNKLKQLQLVFNKAARIITGTSRRERITPVLMDLHWLPTKARIVFKICTMVYTVLKTNKPDYLKLKLEMYQNELTVETRESADCDRFNEPRCNLDLGTRAFSYIAPRLYNKLPNTVKQSNTIDIFKKRLKTHLFGTCYDYDNKVITDEFKL